MRVPFFVLLIWFCAFPVISYCSPDTCKIYFEFNRYNITHTAESILDSLQNTGFFVKIKNIYIAGYADYVGSNNANDIISLQRAGAIRDYLASKLFVRVDSVYIAGFGKSKSAIGADIRGRAADRFVYILVNHFYDKKKDTTTIVRNRVPPFIIKDEERSGIPAGALDYMDKTNVQYLNGELDEQYAAYNGWALSRPLSSLYDTAIIKRRLVTPNMSKFYYSYNSILLAILYALQGKSESVFQYLNFALSRVHHGDEGFEEIYNPNILGFYQFNPYKLLPGWLDFRKRILSNFDTTHILKPELALRIIEKGGLDQSLRINIDRDSGKSLLRFKKLVDKENEIFIRNIVKNMAIHQKQTLEKKPLMQCFC